MKLYEIIATHRSGHHSMMNWLIYNLTGLQSTWKYKMNILNNSGLYQLNCANHDIPLSFELFNQFKLNYKELMVSYEDTHWDYTIFNDDKRYNGKLSLNIDNIGEYKRIIFIRNFYTNLASRLKSNQNKNFMTFKEKNVVQFDVGKDFIWRWKNNAKACLEKKVYFLKFEDWLSNKDIRENFLRSVIGLNEIKGIDNIVGTNSSFGETKNVLERDKMIEIPEEIKDLIRQDNELHYLIGALGYEYKEI